MNDETKISLQFNNTVNNQKKIDEYVKQLEKIYALTDGLKGNKDVLDKVNTNLVETNKQTKNIGKNANSLEKTFKTAFNVAKITAFYQGLTKVWNSMTKFTKASSEYIENVNLLEVAYKNANETIEESSARIESFIDKMAEVYGLDESNLTRQFGIFKQMANAMQLPTETAEHLSELMVKMTNDVASLYNLDLNRASNALQSALAGQVRPIRSATGADITEKTLQNTVDALELDRSISQLSYVEKRLVMVISLTNQLKQSQGDYARTIESTANQFRILGEQWSRLTRSVGNVFYNLLGSILPYLNGILMALTEIFNLIASLLGFEMPEFDYSGLSGVSEAALDIEEGLDGAGASADSLKQKLSGLRGFDKLNVISTPKSSGSAGGVGGAGGAIDPKILNAFTDAFGEYNDLMGSVRMKALDIRDAIMEWLGFTKEINPITGEVEWKYEGIGKTFSNIWESIKKLSPEMQLVVAGLTAMVGAKIIGGIGSLISGFEKLTGWTNSAGETLKGFNKTNIDYWQQNATLAQKFTTALIGAGGVVVGLHLVSDAMGKISEEGLTLGNSLEALGGGLSSILGGAMVGASIGGSGGAVAGGILGGIFALIDGIKSYKTESEIAAQKIIDKSKELQSSLGDTLKVQQQLSDEMKNINKYSDNYKNLVDELVNITDKNGKVKEGYKTRAEFITGELKKAYGIEIEITDDIIENYDTIIKKIYETIEAKRQELLLNDAEKMFNDATEKRKELLDKHKEAQLNLTAATADYNNELDKVESEIKDRLGLTKEQIKLIIKTQAHSKDLVGTENDLLHVTERLGITNVNDYNWLVKKTRATADLVPAVEEATKTEELYSQAVDANAQVQSDYYKVHESIINKDTQNTKWYLQDMTNAYDNLEYNIKTINGEIVENNKNSWSQRIKDAEAYNKQALEQAKKRNEELYYLDENGQMQINAMLKGQLDDNYSEIKTFMTNQLSYVKGVTPEIADTWATLGRENKERFLEYFGELPDEIQKDVVEKMYNLGYDISEDLQKGISQINPTIQFKADTSNVDTAISNTKTKISGLDWLVNNMFSNASYILNSVKDYFKADGGIFYNGGWHNIAGYADGGLPPVGQMFVARENGAELVGTINNHTAVMNNDQIVDSVADGVYRAVVNANATTQQSKTSVMIPIQIGTKEIGRVVINDLQKMAKTNGKPIVIGG